METGIWGFANSLQGTTMAFLTMSIAEVFHSINMRSQRGSIFSLKTVNPLLLVSAAATFILTTIVTQIPVIAGVFGFTVIDFGAYAVSILLGICVIPVVEIVKYCQRKTSK